MIAHWLEIEREGDCLYGKYSNNIHYTDVSSIIFSLYSN